MVNNTEITSSAETLDSILGRTATENQQSTAADPQNESARREKRGQRTGISFAWALILLILTNLAWMGYIRSVDAPRWQATIDEYKVALEEKDEQIRRIQVVYREREKDFEKRLTEAEENYKELSDRLQRAIDKYNKYFGRDDPVE